MKHRDRGNVHSQFPVSCCRMQTPQQARRRGRPQRLPGRNTCPGRSSTPSERQAPAWHGALLNFSPGLSRACLGKISVFIAQRENVTGQGKRGGPFFRFRFRTCLVASLKAWQFPGLDCCSRRRKAPGPHLWLSPHAAHRFSKTRVWLNPGAGGGGGGGAVAATLASAAEDEDEDEDDDDDDDDDSCSSLRSTAWAL